MSSGAEAAPRAPSGSAGSERRPRARRGGRWVVVAWAVALAGAILAGLVIQRPVPPAPVERDPVEQATRAFLERYVAADGRVVRDTEDRDTVSEGQAYALLLSVAIGDAEGFGRVWGWTEANLQRDDGLLAWHWADGEIVDPEPASDADLDAAHALILAAERFAVPRYRSAGLRIARALLAEEVIEAGGRSLLAAGPWATEDFLVVNPSYFDPRAFARLGAETGDRAWDDLIDGSYDALEQLLDDTALPPDWAVTNAEGVLNPASPPGDPGAAAVYSFDAARTPVRMALACDPRGRALAARMWAPFAQLDPGEIRERHDLGGSAAARGRHPLTLVGAAGAATAAGDPAAAAALLDEAGALDERNPSYYGAAWHALGRVLLTSDRLGGCPEAPPPAPGPGQ